jgi:hypothetical protein
LPDGNGLQLFHSRRPAGDRLFGFAFHLRVVRRSMLPKIGMASGRFWPQIGLQSARFSCHAGGDMASVRNQKRIRRRWRRGG